jgi:uncharacterized membrane protein YhaH (DUF805 family)
LAEQWKSRRQRREEAREAAKLLMRQPSRDKKFRWDYTLACVGVSIAIGIVLAPPQTPLLTGLWLLAFFGVLVYPVLHFSAWILGVKRKWDTDLPTVAILVVVVFLFGRAVWPRSHRHVFSETEQNVFEQPLKGQVEPHEEIQITCPQADENTCIYAAQFIDFFRDAGWTVRGNKVERVTLAKPLKGVILFKQGTGKLDPANWRSGLWTAFSPSIKSVGQAFVNVEIEPDSGANPDLPEGVITIYFGPEKPNEAEKTPFTRTMESLGLVPKKR